MSEDGWKGFITADGVDDWVVLHGGATAVFRVRSLAEAATLAQELARIPRLGESGALMTIASDRVSIRLTRDLWQLEARHVDLARDVSAAARRFGAGADRGAVQEVQVAVAARPDSIDLGFWRAVLGYDPRADDNAVDPLGHGSTVWMQELDESKALRHAMHIDVSVAHDHVQARVAAAVAAGGRIVLDAEEPGSWTLADSAGNKVCIAAWPDGATPAAGDPA